MGLLLAVTAFVHKHMRFRVPSNSLGESQQNNLDTSIYKKYLGRAGSLVYCVIVLPRIANIINRICHSIPRFIMTTFILIQRVCCDTR